MGAFSKTNKNTKPIVIGLLFVALMSFLVIYEYRNNSAATPYKLHASLSELSWLVGTWENHESGQKVQEVWKVSNNTLLEGDGYMINKEDTSFHENLSIQSLNGQVVYIAQFSGQAPTMFLMINSEGNYLIFENKEHIYPEKITYNLINDSTMIAGLEGKNEMGEFVSREFRYTKK